MQVDYNNYKEQEFTCAACGWQGKGNELEEGEFSEINLICNLECPECSHLVAFWQAPLQNNS